METGYLKCDDGRCYPSSYDGMNLTCVDVNKNISVGYWNPIYPSQDYWK